MKAPLWISRPLIGLRPVLDWAQEAGIRKIIPPEHLHLTLATVRTPVEWGDLRLQDDELVIPAGFKAAQIFAYTIKALTFGHPAIKARHEELLAMFPQMDHPLLRPHVSLYKGGRMPTTGYEGELRFGPERAEAFDADRAMGIKHVKVADAIAALAD